MKKHSILSQKLSLSGQLQMPFCLFLNSFCYGLKVFFLDLEDKVVLGL